MEEESRLQPLPASTWTINLSVLWASPDITPCDMHQLSHVLADEIYNRVEAREQQLAAAAAWQEEEEEMGENEQAAEFLLNEWADLKDEDYGLSEQSSNEDYDEEAITDILLGKEVAEEEYPFHVSDYDYLANVKGEYDELAVDKETDGFAEDLYDTDDYYK